jgi:hypothetical protein
MDRLKQSHFLCWKVLSERPGSEKKRKEKGLKLEFHGIAVSYQCCQFKQWDLSDC